MSEDVVIAGVGASAGGLEALRDMLATADTSNPVAFVIVQHLDPNHQSMMAELLEPHTPLSVVQASGGEQVKAGFVYVIPPGHGLTIKDGVLALTQFSQPRGLRRPIDDFFVALAEDRSEKAICVILSGTGADGSSGLRAIKEHGGLCVVQDPKTARYDGMPLSAVGTGLVDYIRTPRDIAPTIMGFVEGLGRDADDGDDPVRVLEHLDELCATLNASVGHDFSGYKRSTIVRRIQRRMQVLGLVDGSDYLAHIRDSDEECETLFRELLINVTRFFRDSEQFETLRAEVIAPLVAKNMGEEIRVWVPGCSSGEEAYSFAMYFASELRRARKSTLVQIFATDIDDQMLQMARAGIYPTSALADIPESFREHYTVGRDSNFQIAPKIRDMVRFSAHSIVKDPPFSRLDLISCRNVLIYFGDKLQNQALPIFHYALKPGGHLFLGPSESIGRHEDLFGVMDQKARIFKRFDGPPVYPIDLTASSRRSARGRVEPGHRVRRFDDEWDDGYATERMLERYAPPSLRITEDGEILKSSGQFARYFALSPTRSGPAYVQNLARRGLKEVLPTLIRNVNDDRRRKVVRDVDVQSEIGVQTVDVIADPLPDDTILLVLRDKGDFKVSADDEIDEIYEFDSHEQVVEEELRLTRLRLRSAVEELETANEELKSSNEEMMSMNEELQSTNEELSTVNDELKSKVDELTVANADLKNLFDSTELPLIVVDHDLRVRNFTDGAQDLFSLKIGDRGRPLQDLRSNLEDSDRLMARIHQVIVEERVLRETVHSRDGRNHWALLITPYRMLDGNVVGATLTFADITAALDLELQLRQEAARLKLALEVAKIGFWQYEVETGNTTLDANAMLLFDVDETDSADINAVMKRIVEEDRPMVENALRRAISGEAGYEASFRVRRRDGSVRHLRGLGQLSELSRPKRLVGVNFDQTVEVENSNMRELMIREMNHRVKNLFSIMSALLRVGARTADSAKDLADTLSDRINALAVSHDLSVKEGSRALALKDLVSVSIAAFEGEQDAQIDGPDIQVNSEEITPLALILHEWATNSAKYGALGASDGALAVSWTREGDGPVEIIWEERASRIAESESAPEGFGSQLVRLAATQLGGDIRIDAQDGLYRIGLHCDLHD
ncbi:CheR family methyltransferase [Cognatishimia sp. F0-27]|uniref:CheR family methyltransferase n=1 Tax=Cognatishimia sp. F0-27 TaxID=2816855 RepID=UPI001D0C8165|nr:CheR family methyltransferase [Cognatishimia sp. F0-27]